MSNCNFSALSKICDGNLVLRVCGVRKRSSALAAAFLFEKNERRLNFVRKYIRARRCLNVIEPAFNFCKLQSYLNIER